MDESTAPKDTNPRDYVNALNMTDSLIYLFFVSMGFVGFFIELCTCCIPCLKYFFFYHTLLGKAGLFAITGVFAIGFEKTVWYCIGGVLLGAALFFLVVFFYFLCATDDSKQ